MTRDVVKRDTNRQKNRKGLEVVHEQIRQKIRVILLKDIIYNEEFDPGSG